MSRKLRLEKWYTMMGMFFSTHGLNVELWPKYENKLTIAKATTFDRLYQIST